MKVDYDGIGHGVARDGRRFRPGIPAGATVSWKPLAEPTYFPEHDRTATHVLAVWDRLDEMGLDPECFRQTEEGPCVAYYADAESIEDLIESAVPAPQWIDADVPTEIVVTESVVASWRQLSAARASNAVPSASEEIHWLTTAIWTYRMLTNCWPVLNIHIPHSARGELAPAANIRAETNRLFDMIETELAAQKQSEWWKRSLPRRI